MKQNAEVPCYQHLDCQTKLSCLDWREICNGKSECMDGSDENNCWQLEINQCNANEFRCHNGLCIPMEFFHDIKDFPDCLDRTDEIVTESEYYCYAHVRFRCEEHMCPPGQNDFPCGDGQCTDGIDECNNGRTALSKVDFCSNATACFMERKDLVDLEWCQKYCPNSNCTEGNCPMLYEFPFLYQAMCVMMKNFAQIFLRL
jgi:hypothetical protein